MEDLEIAPENHESNPTAPTTLERNPTKGQSSFRDKLLQNNPNISFISHNNVVWQPGEEGWDT